MSSPWTDQKVLVTGARGFLGANVAERLAQLGASVFGIVRTAAPSEGRIRFLTADVLDRPALHRIFEEIRPDVVFHLAGKTNASHAKELVLPAIESNLISTVLVLSEALENGAPRVVVTGSLEEPLPGQLPAAAISPYAASKWATSVYARMFHALYALPITIVRPYMTYGPHQNAAKVIPYLVINLLRGTSASVSQPDRTVDWVFIEDVVEGMLAAALAPQAVGQSIDFGTGELVSIRDIVRLLEQIVAVPGHVRLQAADQAVGVAGRRADVDTPARLLGWKATTSLEAGLAKTVAWFRDRLSQY